MIVTLELIWYKKMNVICDIGNFTTELEGENNEI
jgi:hypothetical protein